MHGVKQAHNPHIKVLMIVLVFSQWESLDAVRAFAGERPEVAVYYPDDERFLLEFEAEVRHYEGPIAELA